MPGQICQYDGMGLNFGHIGYFHIGILRATTTLTASQSGNVFNERQDFVWVASKKYDKQVIGVRSPASSRSSFKSQFQ